MDLESKMERRCTKRGSVIGEGVKSNSSDLSSRYDYALVFKMEGSEGNYKQSATAKFVVNVLLENDFDVFCYLSVQEDELIILLKPSMVRLKQFADNINFELELDPRTLQAAIEAGLKDKDGNFVIFPNKINDDASITTKSPYVNIFGSYKCEDYMQDFYLKPTDAEAPFSKMNRLKLIFQMLQAPIRQGGCGLEITQWLHLKKLLACFPMHDRSILEKLKAETMDWSSVPWTTPIYDLKEYFGEKIGLYSVFMGFYSIWLIIPSIIGLAFQLVVWGTLDFSSPVLPFYSVVVTIWGMTMLENWKRENSSVTLEWGTSDFEENEMDRPEYYGDNMKSFIDGSDITWYPPEKSRNSSRISRSILFAFMSLVCGVVAAIYVLKFQLSQPIGSYASLVASLLNTVQITIFNIIYQAIAIKLTNDENHRTDTMYEDSLIVKMFVFQFINSYASFFFLAFMAAYLPEPPNSPSNWVGQCGGPDCMTPLSINLAIIFGTRLTLSNFLDIFFPYLAYRQKLKEETKGVEGKALSPAENDFMLMVYDPITESIYNYADVAVQYGFSMLFVTALPIAISFSLLSNYVKLKFNAWKLMTFYQRPIPASVQDLGTWESIFQLITVAAVITNAGLVCYTMTVFSNYTIYGRTWLFIGYQWVLLSLQYFASIFIPDESEEFTIQKKRQAFIVSKVIERIPDDSFGNAERSQNGAIEYVEEEVPDDDHEPILDKVVGFFIPTSQRHEKFRLKKLAARYLDRDVDIKEYPFERATNPLNNTGDV